ncbi:MAG: hypothetical protein V4476_11470 [Pseudomonadota bacterium]
MQNNANIKELLIPDFVEIVGLAGVSDSVGRSGCMMRMSHPTNPGNALFPVYPSAK